MAAADTHGKSLHSTAQFSLFVTSYSPLFLLLVVRQISEQWKYLNWAGISYDSVEQYCKSFFLSTALIIVCIIGIGGFLITIKNLSSVSKNGFKVTLKDIKNKNSEAIGYVATYIIPFLFRSFDGWYQTISILFLLFIIFRIYINSTLILVNPILNIWYGLYEIEFSENGISKTAMMISDSQCLEEGEEVKIYPVGHKLYFSKT